MKVKLLLFIVLLTSYYDVLSQENFNFFHRLNNGIQITIRGVIVKNGSSSNLQIFLDAKGVNKSQARIFWDVKYEFNQSMQSCVVDFFLKKGNVDIKNLKIKTIPSITKVSGFKKEPQYEIIQTPIITDIVGETSIMEGERANLSVSYTGNASDYIWKWYEIRSAHNDAILVQGENVTLPSFAPGTRNCYVVGVHKDYGFTTEIKKFNIEVNPLWVPQNNEFSISTNRNNIYESESVDLSVNGNLYKSNLIWEWYETMNGDSKKLETNGRKITVSPTSNATYKVRAVVNYGSIKKSSEFSNPVTILVRQLKAAPPIKDINANMGVIAPIRDTQSVVISVGMEDVQSFDPDISFEWKNKNTAQTILSNKNSITVKPEETTTYMVRSVRKTGAYKKATEWKEITINVITTSKAPEIFSDTIFCGKNADTLRIRFRKGRLGNGSQKWNLYSGTYSYGGNLIQSVTDDKSFYIPFPLKTATFYITPEFDTKIYKQFTVTIINRPNNISDQLISSNTVSCLGDSVLLKVNMDNIPSGTKYMWYQESQYGNKISFKNTKEALMIRPETKMKYCVNIKNTLCNIETTQCADIKVYDYDRISIPRNTYVTYTNSKKPGASIAIPSYVDDQGANWKWYPNNNADDVVTGKNFYTENKKIKSVALRAEGACGIKDVSTFELNWKKTRHLFYFFNIGVLSQDFNELKNIYLTIGTESVYLRVKNNLDLLTQSISPYQCSNQKILNYPINSNTYYQFTDKTWNKRASYVLGFMTRGNKTKFYFGGGYGERKLFWQANIYQYYTNLLRQTTFVKNIDQTYSGAEGEFGVYFDLKNFNIMMGANVLHDNQTDKTFFDIQAGIGLSTKRKKQ